MEGENLEELTPEPEGAEPTPEVEGKTPTPKKEEPTLGKTYTQKDLDAAVGKGISSVQSQLTLQKAEAEREKQARLAAEERSRQLEEQQFADDPEALAGYRKTRDIEARERAVGEDRKKLEEERIAWETEKWARELDAEFKQLSREFQVPLKAVAYCNTVEEMRAIAKLFPTVESKEAKKPLKKPDSGLSDGGVDLKGMSADDKLRYGFRQMKSK